MDSSLKSDLQNPAFTSFVIVSVALAAGTVRLSSGGDIVYSANTYSPVNATYGALDKVASISDGSDDQIPVFEIDVLLPAAAAKAAWSVVTDQGADVTVYMGTINRATGAVIGVELLFFGEYNYPRFGVAKDSDRVTLVCTSQLARLLEPNHERKLSDAFHQQAWPGELGLAFATRLTKKIYWRATDPSATGVKPKRIFGKVVV